jgi:hypothetical protein
MERNVDYAGLMRAAMVVLLRNNEDSADARSPELRFAVDANV